MFGLGRKYFQCIDLHCGGEPARVLISGCPKVPGTTMAEKRITFMRDFDHIRKLLLQEPRGYPCQNLNIIFPTANPEAEFGYVIAEQNKIYPLFSGHNTICVVTALLETGMVAMKYPTTEFNLEAPGGIIKVVAHCEENYVQSVSLESMPSFMGWSGKKIYVKSIGKEILVDCAFGGMWYTIVNIDETNIGLLPKLEPQNGKQLAKIGEEIKNILKTTHPVQHPEMDYPGPDILAFTSNQRKIGSTVFGKNTVVMSAGQTTNENEFSAILDRSPCGSGTAAIMVNLHHKKNLDIGETFQHESIIGSKFTGKLLKQGPKIGEIQTFIPEICGSAFITGYNNIIISRHDPFQSGYTVADIWT